MSNKKRRNRDKVSLQNTDSILSESIDDRMDIDKAAEPSQVGKTNRFGYLKSNWWMIAVIAFLSIGALGAGLKYLDEDAKGEILRRESNKEKINFVDDASMISKINPFVPAGLPNPTPQLSKEYIYAGDKLLAVEDANANAAPPADLAIWRPSTGQWWVMGQTGSQQVTQQWGTSGDDPVEGDYDGDGKTDFSVFRPSSGTWYITYSAGGSAQYPFGQTGDNPVQADFDGDGKTDAAVYRPATGTWYVQRSSDGGNTILAFGVSTDIPCPADFDGDGRADIAFYRGSDTKFYYLLSSQNNASFTYITFGQNGDKPVPGDYDGDGRADAAVWRGGVFQWHVLYSSTNTTEGFTFGDPNSDKYVHNDYDGDGKVDRAFWRPSTGVWYIAQSSKRGQPDEMRYVQWGTQGDIPVPAFYRR